MEVAPFKFTQEYVDILGGEDSALFRNFRCSGLESDVDNLLLIAYTTEQLLWMVFCLPVTIVKKSCWWLGCFVPVASSLPSTVTN